jgi:hypothetical protein
MDSRCVAVTKRVLRSAFDVMDCILHAEEDCMQGAIRGRDELRDLSEREGPTSRRAENRPR